MLIARLCSRAAWVVVVLSVLLAACASSHKANWVEATDFGVMPSYRKPGEARAKARTVATEHARQQLFDKICQEKVDGGLTVAHLVLLDPDFQSKFAGMVSAAKPEEVPNQPKGIVAIKVGIDKDKVMALARKRQPKISIPKIATPTPASPDSKTGDGAAAAGTKSPEVAPVAVPPQDGSPIQWQKPATSAGAPAKTGADPDSDHVSPTPALQRNSPVQWLQPAAKK